MIHFKNAYEIYKNIKPTFDIKTEETLQYIDDIDSCSLYISGGSKFWNDKVNDAIKKVLLDSTFQSILESNHQYLLGDSCSYMLKKAEYFHNFPDEITKMDILRFVFNFLYLIKKFQMLQENYWTDGIQFHL